MSNRKTPRRNRKSSQKNTPQKVPQGGTQNEHGNQVEAENRNRRNSKKGTPQKEVIPNEAGSTPRKKRNSSKKQTPQKGTPQKETVKEDIPNEAGSTPKKKRSSKKRIPQKQMDQGTPTKENFQEKKGEEPPLWTDLIGNQKKKRNSKKGTPQKGTMQTGTPQKETVKEDIPNDAGSTPRKKRNSSKKKTPQKGTPQTETVKEDITTESNSSQRKKRSSKKNTPQKQNPKVEEPPLQTDLVGNKKKKRNSKKNTPKKQDMKENPAVWNEISSLETLPKKRSTSRMTKKSQGQDTDKSEYVEMVPALKQMSDKMEQDSDSEVDDFLEDSESGSDIEEISNVRVKDQMTSTLQKRKEEQELEKQRKKELNKKRTQEQQKAAEERSKKRKRENDKVEFVFKKRKIELNDKLLDDILDYSSSSSEMSVEEVYDNGIHENKIKRKQKKREIAEKNIFKVVPLNTKRDIDVSVDARRFLKKHFNRRNIRRMAKGKYEPDKRYRGPAHPFLNRIPT